MAEVLMELQKYDAAYQFITKSVKINPRKDSILLQEKIKLRIEDISAEE
jgi:hypothetical protein